MRVAKTPAVRAPRTVRGELGVLFRAIAVTTFLVLLCNAAPRVYLMADLRPRVATLHLMQQQLAQLHSASVDEETGLRGYLATGSPSFLQPYAEALPRAQRASEALSAAAPDAHVATDLVALQIARQRWFDEWARRAADPSQASSIGAAAAGSVQVAPLTAFLTVGKTLFDGYRVAHDRLSADIEGALSEAESDQNAWFLWTGILQIVIATALILLTLASSRRLRRLIASPVASLAGTVARIRLGDLSARVPAAPAPAELIALSRDVDEMAEELQRQATLAQDREAEARLYARRLSLVLEAAREIAGSLSLRYVLEAVTTAARNVGSDRARAWLTDEESLTATLALDTAVPRKHPHPVQDTARGEGVVGRAMEQGTTVLSPSHDGVHHVVAVPMTIGSRLVGILECHVSDAAEDSDGEGVVEILEALAGHAAASLESARLHERTKRASLTDALTGLWNRRAFDHDLDAEVRRAQRYERPLSVLYVDLDHFKSLNDTYGHRSGDIALQQAAATVRAALRDSDRVYRVGGEELVVLAPETNLQQAGATAERLRRAIEICAPAGTPSITASLGVAELPAHAGDGASLLRAADRALYRAKADGRNRVVMADEVRPPTDVTSPAPLPRAAADG